MINRFVLNEVSYFGPGAREVLPQEIKRLGLHKAFVATDKDLIKFGVADKVLKVLENAGIPYEIFSEIKPNPTVSNVKAGVEAFAKSGADFILAIGGGSSIDTSKAIGIITNNPDFSDVVSLEGVAPTRKKSVPIIALPTTAGTAAEVTINYVITDEENHKKMVCVDPNDIPAIAIVDAELMYTLPKGLTASTGLDALTHAIEGLITKGAWEMSDMFEIKAIEMIARYLETAVFEPTNAEARNGMAVAQYIAGMAFSNVGLGVVHGMAHPLGAIFDIPHGVANALNIEKESSDKKFLDKAMQIVKENYKNSYYEISDFIEAMGVSKSLMNKKMQNLTGQSAGQFMRNYRLNLARELIIRNRLTHNMNISEIAYEVGFNDPKYFTRCFTKHFGTTPSSMMENGTD